MNGNVINNKRANRLFFLYILFMNLPSIALMTVTILSDVSL